jgi:hypothetical protein
MVEEALGLEKKVQDKIRPSDLRPQAQFYELVSARNPKTRANLHRLYWWNKGKSELTLEEVDARGRRIQDTSVVHFEANSSQSARKKITDDINIQRGKGIEIKRHQSFDRKEFDKGRKIEGILIPYYKELIKDRDRFAEEASQYYQAAKKSAEEAKEREKSGRVYRKSVSGPSAKAKLKKQENNFKLALKEWESGLKFFNLYLNQRFRFIDPTVSDDPLYREYSRLDRELEDIRQLVKTDSLDEKYLLLKDYEELLTKKLEAHHKIADEKGYIPVKEIPEELLIGEKPKEKKKEVPIEEKPEVEKVEILPKKKQPGKTETKEVPVKVEEPKALKEEVEEVKDIGEALLASAKGLKEKGRYTFSLKGSGAEELVRGIVPRFKEVWGEQGIKIVDFSIDADIKPDVGKIDIDVKVKKYIFSKRIQATLKIESKDGVLNTTQVRANPRVIDVAITSFNIQEMMEENIGGEKIHSIINKWLASEMEARGAKLEKVDFNFTPQDTLQVNVVGGTK